MTTRPIPQANPCKARKIAEVLRKELKLKKPPIVSIQIANTLGLNVEFVTLTEKYQDVAAFYDSAAKTIYVNKMAPPQLYNFAVAREIGHYLMHPDYITRDTHRIPVHTDFYRCDDPYIVEATIFASALLANREWLIDRAAYIKSSAVFAPGNAIEQIAQLCVVPNRVVENERKVHAYVN